MKHYCAIQQHISQQTNIYLQKSTRDFEQFLFTLPKDHNRIEQKLRPGKHKTNTLLSFSLALIQHTNRPEKPQLYFQQEQQKCKYLLLIKINQQHFYFSRILFNMN